MYRIKKWAKPEATMTCSLYRLSVSIMAFLWIFMSVGAVVSRDVLSSGHKEERPNKSLSSDYIITGAMNEYSERYIVVENSRHRLCKDVMVFTPRNTLIPLKDIDAAEEVKLFENNGCVRKIKVLRFAE